MNLLRKFKIASKDSLNNKNKDKVSVIVCAGGVGKRMNYTFPKQFLPLEGKSILAHCLLNLNNIPQVDSITVVVNEGRIQWCKKEIVGRYKIEKVKKVIKGGHVRGESVLNGLKSLDEKTLLVAIHDGVRPFIEKSLFRRVVEEAQKSGAAICAIPLKDTIKKIDGKGEVRFTLNREELWHVQTPQVFRYSLILKAYEKAQKENVQATDDATIVEMLPHPVKIVKGSPFNIKITTPEDLVLAEAILEVGNWYSSKIE